MHVHAGRQTSPFSGACLLKSQTLTRIPRKGSIGRYDLLFSNFDRCPGPVNGYAIGMFFHFPYFSMLCDLQVMFIYLHFTVYDITIYIYITLIFINFNDHEKSYLITSCVARLGAHG